MSVTIEGGAVLLVGDCGVEEAEDLVRLLQSHPGAAVDLSAARHVHTALWQALWALSPETLGLPLDEFAGLWLAPLLPR